MRVCESIWGGPVGVSSPMRVCESVWGGPVGVSSPMRVCESVVTELLGTDGCDEVCAGVAMRTKTVWLVRSANGNEIARARATAKANRATTMVRVLRVTWWTAAV